MAEEELGLVKNIYGKLEGREIVRIDLSRRQAQSLGERQITVILRERKMVLHGLCARGRVGSTWAMRAL